MSPRVQPHLRPHFSGPSATPSLTRATRKLLDTGVAIQMQPPSKQDFMFCHSILAQLCLPRVRIDGREFHQRSGAAWISLQAGMLDEGAGPVWQPVPHGMMARLLLMCICTSRIRRRRPMAQGAAAQPGVLCRDRRARRAAGPASGHRPQGIHPGLGHLRLAGLPPASSRSTVRPCVLAGLDAAICALPDRTPCRADFPALLSPCTAAGLGGLPRRASHALRRRHQPASLAAAHPQVGPQCAEKGSRNTGRPPWMNESKPSKPSCCKPRPW